MAKESNNNTGTLSHKHIEWLIKSRFANQNSSLLLHKLLDTHFNEIKRNVDKSKKSQILTAICFSLWRAAFLADKTSSREAVLKHAQSFLEKMLADNAITYPQDRASREWTFNYYVNNAKDNLLTLAKYWPEVRDTLSAEKKVEKGTTAPGRRWDRHQSALDVALNSFQRELRKKKKVDTKNS